MTLGIFQVIAEPVSTWVQEIFEWRRRTARLGRSEDPAPTFCIGRRTICTVEY